MEATYICDFCHRAIDSHTYGWGFAIEDELDSQGELLDSHPIRFHSECLEVHENIPVA